MTETSIETRFICYRKGYKYQLARDYKFYVGITPVKNILTQFIALDTDGYLQIKSGYSWDGPSGPTIDTPNFMTGSLVHDALYQLMRMSLLRQRYRLPTDGVLWSICRSVGMCKFRAWYVRRSLKIAGAAAASPKNIKEIYTAPAPKIGYLEKYKHD